MAAKTEEWWDSFGKYSLVESHELKAIMKITSKGIFVDPSVDQNEAASALLKIIDKHIKSVVDGAVNRALLIAAENCFNISSGDECARMIKNLANIYPTSSSLASSNKEE